MNIRTFSIVGRSADGQQLGVAVASKFLAVGAFVPSAKVGVGALATQALGNLELHTRGMEMLASGVAVTELFDLFFQTDPKKENRQAGVVDASGKAATFTGSEVTPWAGGRAGEDPGGSFAAQGNMLAGPEVIDAMVDTWFDIGGLDTGLVTERQAGKDVSLARRLVQSLAAGQEAGGDPRGKQAAAVLVVGKGQGYGGLSDVAVDLRSDDSPNPIGELDRMLNLHDLYFGSTPDEELLELDRNLMAELKVLLSKVGYRSGDLPRDLYAWMSRENFEERWHDKKIDPVVLEQLNAMASKVSETA